MVARRLDHYQVVFVYPVIPFPMQFPQLPRVVCRPLVVRVNCLRSPALQVVLVDYTLGFIDRVWRLVDRFYVWLCRWDLSW